MATDKLTRIICDALNVRAYSVVTLTTSAEIAQRHGATPLATLHLARAVNACTLLGAGLKPESDQSISLKFSGGGPIRELHIQADARGNVRGYIANPLLEPEEGEGGAGFGRLIGACFLTVIKDLGLREPYFSTSPLHSGDIALDVAHYLTFSEQVPSAIIIAARLDEGMHLAVSGGLLVQIFPGTDPEVIADIEKRIVASRNSLGDHLLAGGDIHEFLTGILGGAPCTVEGEIPLRHRCRCSREMLGEILGGFSDGEITDMIEKNNGAEVECAFCRSRYHFNAPELQSFVSARKGTGLN